MRHIFSLTIATVFSSIAFGQTAVNLRYFEMTWLQRVTPTFGLHLENRMFRLEAGTSYTMNSENSRFQESTSRPEKPSRFIHGRFGITAIQARGATQTRHSTVYEKEKDLGGGWWLVTPIAVTTVFSDNLILEPGVDFYQYYATTRGDAMIYGTNGQAIGQVVGSNMRVYSGYARLTLSREFESGTARFYFEYLRAVQITMEDVMYGQTLTGLQAGGNSGFDYKKWGMKFGVELYAHKAISTRFALGSSPGIKGRNSFATIISLGFPFALGSR